MPQSNDWNAINIDIPSWLFTGHKSLFSPTSWQEAPFMNHQWDVRQWCSMCHDLQVPVQR
ncbi:hypothetical protein [Desulfamplus magnetovallimortis]|uniref:hypothetical protein n=1 Tax=Desulfamplus magnetovallimortis TaxID=1246637 RepID=UPI00111BBA62|nr:hypothetical protein [Desulfamplus magnetovallimortis]